MLCFGRVAVGWICTSADQPLLLLLVNKISPFALYALTIFYYLIENLPWWLELCWTLWFRLCSFHILQLLLVPTDRRRWDTRCGWCHHLWCNPRDHTCPLPGWLSTLWHPDYCPWLWGSEKHENCYSAKYMIPLSLFGRHLYRVIQTEVFRQRELLDGGVSCIALQIS